MGIVGLVREESDVTKMLHGFEVSGGLRTSRLVRISPTSRSTVAEFGEKLIESILS